MKRLLTLLFLCVLCLPLACKGKPAPSPEPVPAVLAPAEQEIKLRLPLGARNDVAKTLPAYTAGFAATSGDTLTFTVVSEDARVAEGILKDDGTLYVIAHGTGETKLTVAAVTASGEKAASVVTVKVTDARRTIALIALGVLAVALLILLGKPAAKKPETPVVIEEPREEPETPTVIFEEPKNDPERS